jgi:hypothetical protein
MPRGNEHEPFNLEKHCAVMTTPHVYLSRRNLLTLINKLDRVARGESSECTLVKCDTKNKAFPQTHPSILVTAVEDEHYYVDRSPGLVHHKDEPK